MIVRGRTTSGSRNIEFTIHIHIDNRLGRLDNWVWVVVQSITHSMK